MRILSYQYEADHHCIDCTADRYESNGFKDYEDNKLIAQYKVDRISGSILDKAYDNEMSCMTLMNGNNSMNRIYQKTLYSI